MEEDFSKKTTVELVTEMTYLDLEIDTKLFRYEQIRSELVKRFPQVKDDEEFKQKVRKKVLSNGDKQFTS